MSIAMADQDIDTWYQTCEELEKQSGKLARKWTKTQHDRRLAYLEMVFQKRLFAGKIAYMVFKNSRDYDNLKAHAIAQAASSVDGEADRTVIIDGLPKEQWTDWGRLIRKAGGKIQRTRGAKDQNDAIIRLADSVCGLIRSALYESNPRSIELFNRAVKDGILKPLD